MKVLSLLLFIAGYAHAQTPGSTIRRDSLPTGSLTNIIPNVRPSNSFYRDKRDGPNVMRATLDNMPIHTPDTSVTYTIQQSKYRYQMPMPRLNVPKKKE